MRRFLSGILALFVSGASLAANEKCPFHEEGAYPWSSTIPTTVDGDLWAWVYLDLDKDGVPLRCYIGKTNISGTETRSNVCKSFLRGWRAIPLVVDGKHVAGTTRRLFVITGSKHEKLLKEAKKRWFTEHPDDDPHCYI